MRLAARSPAHYVVNYGAVNRWTSRMMPNWARLIRQVSTPEAFVLKTHFDFIHEGTLRRIPTWHLQDNQPIIRARNFLITIYLNMLTCAAHRHCRNLSAALGKTTVSVSEQEGNRDTGYNKRVSSKIRRMSLFLSLVKGLMFDSGPLSITFQYRNDGTNQQHSPARVW